MLDEVGIPAWVELIPAAARRCGRWGLALVAAMGVAAILALAFWGSPWVALLLVLGLWLICGAALIRTSSLLALQRLSFNHTSTLDDLTALPHRRQFLRVAEREWALAERHNHALALALIDVDHFKRVNESFGQHCGDALLQQVASALELGLRHGDVLARYSGEEFALLLPLTDPLGALDVAERVRERVATLAWSWQGRPVALSVTIGIGSRRDEGGSLDLLIADAEMAQLRAKHSGGNCVRGDVLASALIPG